MTFEYGFRAMAPLWAGGVSPLLGLDLMANSRKPRSKTKPQMRRLVEEIVLTEEDEKILDSVWDQMRRELIQKRKREEALNRKKTATQILDLARENGELREALLIKERG